MSNRRQRMRMIGLPAIPAVLAAVPAAAPENPSRLNPRDGLTYRWIQPGSYITGCLPGDQECYGLERKREKIDIVRGFWIGRTEVTQAAYKRVMGADPSRYKDADRSVDSVGWNDATDYCSQIGMRLPTESGWGWATYGGTAELPSEPLDIIAWLDANSNDSTHPVATKLPNGYGLFDMLGNVWEWVQDAGQGPGEHALKGGSFCNIARDVRVSERMSSPPAFGTAIWGSGVPRTCGREAILRRSESGRRNFEQGHQYTPGMSRLMVRLKSS